MSVKRPVLKPKTNVAALIFIVLFALAFVFGIALLVFGKTPYQNRGVVLYTVKNTQQLKERLSLYSPLNSYFFAIEPYLLKSLPRDFAHLDAKQRKELFIKAMLPIAFTVKAQFDREHELFIKLKEKLDNNQPLSEADKKLLAYGLRKFRCKTINELIKKSGSIPVSLLIAQAGIESGWGSSRFAIYYNNVYGIHKKHPRPGDIVRRFSSLYDATVCYMLNLDRSPAYKRLREARYRMGRYPNPYKLAEYLTLYSTRRGVYVRLVQRIISSNNLAKFDKLYPSTFVAENPKGLALE
ncbi:glucosaminidase domain-containing protein [Hippea maritima]|uniref:Mannosyl-glycoprotein endo-beta-N-acetylglucosamidase n=1 Tax=Hippea maritima (strain ATCC 700847 / DSM 10411 / MH2) TaxID=760142 RepID=F2LXJ8_HIPMA|nr:glucosaminidase domain-containing protein [Hippea maritima]AEA33184.1 Mannosyl-glycoprotein endo-beta-N-acetylglucosamidase [Hippea maritima DSM 10411]